MNTIEDIKNYLEEKNAEYVNYYDSAYAYIDHISEINDDYTIKDFNDQCATIGIDYDKPIIIKNDPDNIDIQAYNIDGLDWFYIKAIIDDMIND